MFPTQRLSGAQVYADKIGTVVAENGELCVWGNYAPVWTDLRQTYTVRGLWVDALWKARKLDHAKYDEYVVQARDGVPGRKRNLAAVLEAEEEAADDAEMAETIKRIRGNPRVYRPMKKFPPLEAWPCPKSGPAPTFLPGRSPAPGPLIRRGAASARPEEGPPNSSGTLRSPAWCNPRF